MPRLKNLLLAKRANLKNEKPGTPTDDSEMSDAEKEMRQRLMARAIAKAAKVRGRRVTPGETLKDTLARGEVARPGGKTGSPDWFRSMKARAAVRDALVKVPTMAVDGLSDKTATALVAAGLDNVWKLSQARVETLLAIPGIGPASLAKVRATLIKHSVPVAWKAD